MACQPLDVTEREIAAATRLWPKRGQVPGGRERRRRGRYLSPRPRLERQGCPRSRARRLGVQRNTVLTKLSGWGIQRPGTGEGRNLSL